MKNRIVRFFLLALLSAAIPVAAGAAEDQAAARSKQGDPKNEKKDGKVTDADRQLYMVRKEGKYGYINSTGELVVPCQYELANPFVEGMASVMAVGKWGFIDGTGKMAVKPLFDEVRDFSDGYAAVRYQGRFGYVNKQGFMAIKPQFDRAEKFSEKIAAVMLDNKWGYIDKLGHFIVKPQFFRASDFQNGLAVVMTFRDDEMSPNLENALLGYINRKGDFVWRPTR